MKTETTPTNTKTFPAFCGTEDRIDEVMRTPGPYYLPNSTVNFGTIQSCFASALHMHQPLVPAQGNDLKTAQVISNLKSMMENGDEYNASVFRSCYKRLGEFIPTLVDQGKKPRIMLDYSGSLLWGLIEMGYTDVIDALKILNTPDHNACVEWLGTPWGHPVAPSTPVQDFRLHVRAWQHFFGEIFGADALMRMRGFSPSEMALPNHPDVFYEFVKTLKECGYRWVLVQEHTIELADPHSGGFDPYVPHKLIAKNSKGESLSITAIVKTQGSDTKLVAQMQPYYEAKTLGRRELAGQSIPALVTQIADGENGGVMMNEFPSKYLEVMAEATDTQTPAVNVSEYLEYLDSLGINEEDYPAVQPIMQGRIWDRFQDSAGPEALENCITTLKQEDDRFHMEGGSWTSNLSWVHGYEDVLGPMQKASALFSEKLLSKEVSTQDPQYQEALFLLMCSQTSCFRYWGEGQWTDYGRELCRRAMERMKDES